MKCHALLAPLSTVTAALVLVACYNPQIEDGALACSARFECPSGFTCLATDNRCHKAAGSGGSGGSDGTGGSGGRSDGAGGAAGRPPDGGNQICAVQTGVYGPITGCASRIDSVCDPVCQAGCKCDERCKLESNGPACRAEAPPFAQQYDRCEPATDTCRPGFICLEERANRPDCAAHCYRLCRTDAQCPTGTQCIDDLTVGARVMVKSCSIPTEACTPYGRAACGMPVARPLPAFACYTVPGTPDLTACECAGVIQAGMPCANFFDCVAGYECVAIGTAKTCLRVCLVGTLATTGGACPGLQTCTAFPGGTKHGYCR